MMRDLSEVEAISTFPTSIGQKRCWFMEQIHPGNRGLNLAVRWELRGPATSEMVQSAFNRIISRHEILRTRFVELDGEPVQRSSITSTSSLILSMCGRWIKNLARTASTPLPSNMPNSPLT